MKINKDIVCIVVTHNPPPTINKLAEQISNIRILMIDSSDSDKYNLMKEHFKNKENVIIYHEDRHIGLGNALNIGIKMSQEIGFKYLLIMEDDSYFRDNVDLANIINKFSYSHNNECGTQLLFSFFMNRSWIFCYYHINSSPYVSSPNSGFSFALSFRCCACDS